MWQVIDRKRLKADMKQLLRTAQVPAKAMTAQYLLLIMGLDLADGWALVSQEQFPGWSHDTITKEVYRR